MAECNSNFYSIATYLSNYLDNVNIALLSRTCRCYYLLFRNLQYGYFECRRYPDNILQLVTRMTNSSLQYINIPKSKTSSLLLNYAIALDPVNTIIIHNDDEFESRYMHCDWDIFRRNKEITAVYDRVVLYYVGNNSTASGNSAIEYILGKQVWIFNYSNKTASKLLPLYKPYVRNMNYINATKYKLEPKAKLKVVNIDNILGITNIPAIMFALGYPHLSSHYVDINTCTYRLEQVLFLAAVQYIGGSSVLLHHNASTTCNNTKCNLCSLLMDTTPSNPTSNHIVIASIYDSKVVNALLESTNYKYIQLTVLYSRTIQGSLYEQRILQGVT